MTTPVEQLDAEEFVRWCYRTILLREPDPVGREYFGQRLAAGVGRLVILGEFLECDEYRSRHTGPPQFMPPGHYYSPIPSREDVEEHERRFRRPESLPGIDLDDAGQLALLGRLAPFYAELPFTDDEQPGLRYRYRNPSYAHGDGIFLYSMLRHLRPKRLIEVGSGFTSAVTLDTNERFLGNSLECWFVEPYPDLLHTLLKPQDAERVTIIPRRLQDVDLALFDQLAAGDVLFIDSTHVAKIGSDVNRIVFDILPRLAVGVYVHFHDIFYPFEYPSPWLREGRAWNEQYVLRAFLAFNPRFAIRLFGEYAVSRFGEWFAAHMPLCLRNPGGALWIERVG